MIDLNPLITQNLGLLHQQKLLQEAEEERWLTKSAKDHSSISDRFLSHMGVFFISIGTKMVDRAFSFQLQHHDFGLTKQQTSTCKK